MKYLIIILFLCSCSKKEAQPKQVYGLIGVYNLEYSISSEGIITNEDYPITFVIDENNFAIVPDTGSSVVNPYYTLNDSIYIQASNGLVVHHYKAYKEYLELTKDYGDTTWTIFCNRVE